MAPTKAPVVRAATSHTKTPSLSSRSIVPAIPLAMMPKRASKSTSSAKDNISATNAAAAASLDAALIGHGSSASDETSPATPSVPNASSNGSGSGNVPGKTSNKNSIHGPSSNGIHVDGHANGTRACGGTAKLAKSLAQPSTQESASRVKPATIDKPRTNGETVTKEPDQTRDYPSQPPSPETTPEEDSQPTLRAQNPNAEPIALTTFATSNTNHETPHFQPMHQSRLSNGVEIMFGGFPNSHTPSPAPMPFGAAAFGPPPQPSLNGSRMPYHHGPDHSQSNSVHSGLSAAVRADGLPAVAALEGYGQPHASTQARGDSFNHNPARHGPPTPMSYHGSHNSVDTINNVEMNGTFVPAPGMPHVATNQALGFHPPAPPFPAFMPPNIYNDRSIVVEDQLMGSIDYFRAQFGNTELSDSIIELVYVDGRRSPVKLPGHRIILCRSPTLKRHVMLAMRQSQSSAITIQTDDKFVRSDAWWMALQRLYLHPLLNLPPMAGSAKGADFAGDHGDRFEFCLGYAAAGHLLQLHDVLLRGLHMAADLVNWNTVETALEFVLHNTRQRHTDYSSEQDGSYQSFVDMEYGYGPDTRVLMDAIITFLIAAFPPQFELDANVSDPVSYARIPQLPGVPALVSPTESIPPAIARGTNSQHRSTPSRLGNIKFGDLPSSDTHNAQGPRTPPSSYTLILSRVLLNLPFDELRAVLSYGQSNNASWKSAQSRMRAIPSVIAGREARRLRTLELIRYGVSPNTRAVKERLSANRRHAIVEPWDVLNWVELVSFNENNEAVGLARNWQPTFSIGAQSSQPHVPKIAQSMV